MEQNPKTYLKINDALGINYPAPLTPTKAVSTPGRNAPVILLRSWSLVSDTSADFISWAHETIIVNKITV